MTDMSRIKEVEKDLREVIDEVLETDISEREAIVIIEIASRDKEVYDAVLRMKDNPDCDEANDNYNSIVNCKILDLYEKFFKIA